MPNRHPRSALVAAFVILPFLAVLSRAALSAQAVSLSPALPTTSDHVVLRLTAACTNFDPPRIEGNTITLVGHMSSCTIFLPVLVTIPLPPLSAGSYTVHEVVNGQESPDTTVFQVTPPSTSMKLLGERYSITATFIPHLPPGAGTAAKVDAHAVRLSDESGYLWFFDSSNVEITAKMLDGRAVNGHFWVFLSSLSDVAFSITVTDIQARGCSLPGSTIPCISKTYVSTPGMNQNIIDLGYWADFP